MTGYLIQCIFAGRSSEDLETMGCETTLQSTHNFNFIVDTVSAPHDYTKYLNILDTDGVMICVGAPPEPTPIAASGSGDDVR